MQRPVQVGERLLVSGEPRWGGEPLDDAIAWERGFTGPFSEALSREWASAIDSAAPATDNADAACQAWVPAGYRLFNAAPTTIGQDSRVTGRTRRQSAVARDLRRLGPGHLRSVVSRVRRRTGLRHLRGLS
jgi:hypothetical protein